MGEPQWHVELDPAFAEAQVRGSRLMGLRLGV
jgi:hypothetical protein